MVVIAIIAILAGIMFPVFANAKEKARQTQCASNQRQLAMAIIMYAQDRERFPGTEWGSDIDIPGGKNLLACPDADERQQTAGYGMNAYLHGLKQDIIQRPQMVVCTCDATDSSTISADHKRHKGFAIYSHVDGSVKITKVPADGGRFAAGPFPLTPTILVGNQTIDVPPDNFTDYAANTPIAKEFIVAGPYGSDDETMKVSTAGDLLELDYVGEDDLAKLTADDIPIVGEAAPRIEEIKRDATDPSSGKLITHWQLPKIGSWTPTSGTAQDCVRLELVDNYNTQYPKRTTYAMLFVYSDRAQSATMKFMIDDVGIVWMNGQQILKDPLANDLNAEMSVNQVTMTMPKGISYILFRDTNWIAGGMKFNVTFNIPVKVGGSI